MLNSQTTLSLAMLLFLVLPVLVWLTLPRQAHWEVDLWCLGNLIAGVGIVLLGMRSKLPVVVSFHLANTLILSCFLCCSQSLRMTLGHDWRWRGLALRMFMAFVFYSVLFEWAAEAWRGVLYRLVLGFLSISTAYWAWRMYRNKDSLNAAAMALAYLVVGLSLTAHSLWTAGHIVESSPFSNTWDASVISLVVLLMTVVTNLCYMGMVLDLAARESLLSQRAQQAARDTELLEAQLRRLERRGRISIISGSLAHELNQPLTAATMNAQLAQRQWATHPVSSPMLLELLAQVEAGVDRTVRILQRIRDGNAVVAQPHEQVDLQAILDRTLAQMASEIQRLSVTVTHDKAIPSVWCMGDELGLSQVVINLLRNALQSMAGQSMRHLWVACSVQQNLATLEIRDSGPGMSKELIERWGEPFVSTRQEGMGLGLAISREIVSRHQGQLMLANLPQGGLQARVVMPASNQAAAT